MTARITQQQISDVVDKLTYEQKVAIAESAGWQTLWHKDNWIRTCWLEDRKMNIDWAGEPLNNVIKRILRKGN